VWQVLSAELPLVSYGGGLILVCVFFSLLLFSCFCRSSGWVFGDILVFESITFSRFYWGPTGWHWVGSASCSLCSISSLPGWMLSHESCVHAGS